MQSFGGGDELGDNGDKYKDTKVATSDKTVCTNDQPQAQTADFCLWNKVHFLKSKKAVQKLYKSLKLCSYFHYRCKFTIILFSPDNVFSKGQKSNSSSSTRTQPMLICILLWCCLTTMLFLSSSVKSAENENNNNKNTVDLQKKKTSMVYDKT